MRDVYAASRKHVDRPRFFHDSNANMTRFHHAREDQRGHYSYGVEFSAARQRDEDEQFIRKVNISNTFRLQHLHAAGAPHSFYINREGAARGSSDGGRDYHREAGDFD
ncbi:hypothetical protein TSUD_52880 [Trifolium subterraneum]|uniref:Uncharacterized protein n=1 Tax=Trifolium subterraneum TaxID=3900 RepID=A0A2Z6NCP2_TRISU|nr:hypothetical protein TSUD_52880 [Trifolium subterraneum]